MTEGRQERVKTYGSRGERSKFEQLVRHGDE